MKKILTTLLLPLTAALAITSCGTTTPTAQTTTPAPTAAATPSGGLITAQALRWVAVANHGQTFTAAAGGEQGYVALSDTYGNRAYGWFQGGTQVCDGSVFGAQAAQAKCYVQRSVNTYSPDHILQANNWGSGWSKALNQAVVELRLFNQGKPPYATDAQNVYHTIGYTPTTAQYQTAYNYFAAKGWTNSGNQYSAIMNPNYSKVLYALYYISQLTNTSGQRNDQVGGTNLRFSPYDVNGY
ncbi:hypothetical protein [Deinococcus sp. Leaf326]|uniref:hypothetical protein n=1 Tax=Deinococcus sp. Leaf326 TaxID=1736338 RepID=UPI0007019FD5|nr:hypothetical protein [Deinococcus sp. Leaf326]KQR26990.1 hypothetical protein ASF71_18025 [Deinococcus sp. Leaf326]